MMTETGFYAPYPKKSHPWFAPNEVDVTEIVKAKCLAKFMLTNAALDLTAFWNETWQDQFPFWDGTLMRNTFSADPVSPQQPQAAYYVMRTLSTQVQIPRTGMCVRVNCLATPVENCWVATLRLLMLHATVEAQSPFTTRGGVRMRWDSMGRLRPVGTPFDISLISGRLPPPMATPLTKSRDRRVSGGIGRTRQKARHRGPGALVALAYKNGKSKFALRGLGKRVLASRKARLGRKSGNGTGHQDPGQALREVPHRQGSQ